MRHLTLNHSMRTQLMLTEMPAADWTCEITYVCAFSTMAMIVTYIYACRGAFVVFRILAYLTALATVSISLKLVFVKDSFNFPKFVSFVHFVSTLLVCLGMTCYQRIVTLKQVKAPGMQQFGCMILPTAFTFALSVGAANLALLYAHAGFVEMVGSCTPVCVVLVSISLGQHFDRRLLVPVLIVTMGLALCAKGEMEFSFPGFVLAFTACMLRAVKTTLQGILLDISGEIQNVVLEPLELLIWIGLPSTLIMLVWSLLTEGLEPLRWFSGHQAATLVLDLGLSCAIACSVNILGLYVLQDLGVVGSQLAGQLKSVLTVMGCVTLLGEAVKPMQVCGFACIILGVMWYNRVEAKFQGVKEQAMTLEPQLFCECLCCKRSSRHGALAAASSWSCS